jgi:alpha-beta hydrolase superfamily lysophospholipase
MPFDRRFEIASPTGATLNCYSKRAAGPARGVVQVNHGLAEHAARYARFAEFLAVRGFHTYAHDHHGHGFTKAADAPQGIFARANGADKVVEDVAAVHELIAKEHPGLPVIAFGHSMGALVTLNFVLKHSARIRAAAIWNGNFSAGLLGRAALAVLAWERFRLGSDMPSRIMPKLTFQAWAKQVPNARTAFDWLSRDPAEVDKYIADPLCGWDASVSLWRDVFTFIFRGAENRNFAGVRRDLPFDLVGGGRDPQAGNGKTVLDLDRQLRAMGFSEVETIIYPENRHEGLNELNRDEVMADFADWAERVTA